MTASGARVVFVGEGAGPNGRVSEEGGAAIAAAAHVLAEADVPLGDAAVARIAQRTTGTLVRVVADPLTRARAEIDALLARGLRVALVPGVDTRPLAGVRVVVTRAAEQAGALAAQLEDRGAQPWIVPVLTFDAPPDPEPMQTAARMLATYDWVAFTSANGVERFLVELRRAGRDARAFGRARIAAIGPGTAAALERASLVPDRVATEHRGEGLAEVILEVAKPGERLLLPRALVARDVLPEALRAAGLHVDVVPVYETKAPPGEAGRPLADALEAGEVGAITLTSSSTATHLVALLGARAAELLARTVVASIGPITTDTAAKLGLRVDLTAHPHTIPALVGALEAHFEKLRLVPD